MKFSAHNQQLLRVEIEGGAVFGVVVVADDDKLIQKVIHVKFQNLNSLHLVIVMKCEHVQWEEVYNKHLMNDLIDHTHYLSLETKALLSQTIENSRLTKLY